MFKLNLFLGWQNLSNKNGFVLFYNSNFIAFVPRSKWHCPFFTVNVHILNSTNVNWQILMILNSILLLKSFINGNNCMVMTLVGGWLLLIDPFDRLSFGWVHWQWLATKPQTFIVKKLLNYSNFLYLKLILTQMLEPLIRNRTINNLLPTLNVDGNADCAMRANIERGGRGAGAQRDTLIR